MKHFVVVRLMGEPPTLFVKLHPGYIVTHTLNLPARQ